MDPIQPISSEDILVWPDGTYCYREDLQEYSHMSDDYRVVAVGTSEWWEFAP